jgi:hypothetical protein
METGKFAYNANVIWLLYPSDPDSINQPYQTLELEYAKNKLSYFKGIQALDFIRSTGVIKEWNLPTQAKGGLFADLGGEIEK